MTYYISTTLQASFEDALARTVQALSEEGFGVVTRIDMRETLKQKLGVNFRAYTILGGTNEIQAEILAKRVLDL